MLKIVFTEQFKKDFKYVMNCGCDIKKFKNAVILLSEHNKLPLENRDYGLLNSRNYKNIRECRIDKDWFLLYKISNESSSLNLIRIGSRSELFL